MDGLIVFDMDGTLINTNKVDCECFVQAFADEFGITQINTNWTDYQHATDSWVFHEIIGNHLGRRPGHDDSIRFTNRFVGLLEDSFNADPGQFSEIPGASAMFAQLRQSGRWAVAIATGACHASAHFKLSKVEIDVANLPIASADDAFSRGEIVKLAIDRASQMYGQESFDRIVSVGDAPWDVSTARNMGLPFVGINGDQQDPDQLERLGAKHVLADFTDQVLFSDALEAAEVPAAGMTN